jgi:hypothetical protein
MNNFVKKCPLCCGAGYNKTIDDHCPCCGGNGLLPDLFDLVETGLGGVVMLRPKADSCIAWPTACGLCNHSLFPSNVNEGVCPDCGEPIPFEYISKIDMKTENDISRPCFTEISPIESKQYGNVDILGMMLDQFSSNPDLDGNFPSSNKWEWFDPTVLTLAEYKCLPPHWQAIVRNTNSECWSIGYRYVHCPVPIFADVPRGRAASGIFAVMSDATHENVRASDLVHLGGQFTTYDTNDKCVWMDQLNY